MESQQTPKQNSGTKLDRKSKILFFAIGLLIAGSVAATYWRIVVKRDYIVQAQTDCDPTAENCFVWKCDPNSTVEGEACTGDPEKDTWYYKIIRRNAKNIPLCDPNDENCTALTCEPEEKDCSEELCAPQNVSEKESCNDPVQYLKDNPPEEDSGEECAPDDQECLDSQSEEEACAPDDQECLHSQDESSSEGDQACAPDNKDCAQEESPAPDSGNPDQPSIQPM